MNKIVLALALALAATAANADTLIISGGGFIQTFTGTYAALDMSAHTLTMDWTSTGSTSGSLSSSSTKSVWTFELRGGGEDSIQHLLCAGRLQTLVSGPSLTLYC